MQSTRFTCAPDDFCCTYKIYNTSIDLGIALRYTVIKLPSMKQKKKTKKKSERE